MKSSDEYSAKALECLNEADRTKDPEVREQLTNLAVAYVKLAALAWKNAQTELPNAPVESQSEKRATIKPKDFAAADLLPDDIIKSSLGEGGLARIADRLWQDRDGN